MEQKSIIGCGYMPRDVKAVCLKTDHETLLDGVEYKIIAAPYERSLREYLQSETYSMMTDSELEMWEFGASAIFEMWENEKITGNPRNSIYLRRE